MRKLLIILSVTVITSCSREEAECPHIQVVITNQAPTCLGWGIVVGGTVYPSRNIPDAFKQNGLTVCADYTVFNDPAACPCCGGMYADILSMSEKN